MRAAPGWRGVGLEPSVVWDAGVHIESTLLWFDPRRPRDFCLLTNTRAHLGERQTRLLKSDMTARLLNSVAGRRLPGLVSPFGRPVNLGNLAIEMFPSGYVAGAASYRVTLPSGSTLVYSGPFAGVANRTAEKRETRRADFLVLDATYGAPRFALPNRGEAEDALDGWLHGTLADGLTPVLLVANPGKAQDILHFLGERGHRARLHRTVHEWSAAYRAAGWSLPAAPQFRGAPATSEVLLWPAHLRRSSAIRNLRRARFAAATGWAAEPGSEKRLKVSRIFNWSCRADFPALLQYARDTQPKRVWTVGRHAVELATALAEQGLAASPLRESPQLRLL